MAPEKADAELLPCQAAAIANIRSQALSLRPDAESIVAHVFRMSNIDRKEVETVLSAINQSARIALHFHPDRPVGGGLVVSSALLEDGFYRNQFETLISNGLVAAYRGGPRDQWESKLFEGAYDDPNQSLACRPKYGALDLTGSVDGPAARFGSCYLLLKPSVSKRSTFTFGGSQDDPKYRGTIDEFHAILSALLEELFTRDFMLGVSDIRPPEAIRRIISMDANGFDESGRPSGNLDHMIEAQIHGDISLARDVDAVVADAAFRDTEVGDHLRDLAQKYGFPLRFHRGYKLSVASVPSDFRGPNMPSLAERVAKDGVIDPYRIGLAVQDLTKDTSKWEDRGTYAEVLQELKLLWHVLVKYGS